MREHFKEGIGNRGLELRNRWMKKFEEYKEKYPRLADHLYLMQHRFPPLDRSKYAPAAGLAKGAYILACADNGKPDLLLIASGSEVYLCVEAYEQLKEEGINARVISMSSWELFEKQSPKYKEEVLPYKVLPRVSVEQASTFGWSKYVGSKGCSIGMETFGASAPLKELQKKSGLPLRKLF